MTNTSRTCRTCGQDLPLDAFAKDYHTVSGYKISCRDCSQAAKLASKKGNPRG